MNSVNGDNKKRIKKNIIKIFLILKILLILASNDKTIKKDLNYMEDLNKNYIKIQNDINLHFKNKIKKKIKIGILTYSLKNGGLQRLTSLIIKFFEEMKIYEIYLFTKLGKEKNEYIIPDNIPRIVLSEPRITNLINQIYINKIDI